jgi:outer membrane protein
MSNNAVRILCMSFCFLLPCVVLHADDDVRAMILSASGVTEDDISSAALKTSISLYDAFALSVRYTEKLPIAGENVIQADSQHSQAIGSYLPNVTLNAAKPILNNSSTTGPIASKAYAYLYVRQPIISGLNEWTNISRQKSVTSISRHILFLSAQQQLLTIAQKYYFVCQLQSTLGIKQEILGLYRKTRAELVRRVAVGKNRQGDILRTDAQIARLEAQLASISSQVEAAKSDLATSTGISATVAMSGGIEIPPPAYKSNDLRSIVSRRLEIVIAKENIDVADMNLKAAWGGHLPTVYLEGNYRLYTEGNNHGDKFSAAIVASMPIFNGMIDTEKVSQAESMRRQTELVLSQTTRAVEEDINTSYDMWVSAVKQSDAYKSALESAERNYAVTMNDYRLNLVTILDVISVLTDLQQARIDYKTALLAAGFARIRLGVATNEFPGSGNDILKNAPQMQMGKTQ